MDTSPASYTFSTDPAATNAESARAKHARQDHFMACSRLAGLPNRFRATGTWLSHFTLLCAHVKTPEDRKLVTDDVKIALAELDEVMA